MAFTTTPVGVPFAFEGLPPVEHGVSVRILAPFDVIGSKHGG
jgi:hypothetical protein